MMTGAALIASTVMSNCWCLAALDMRPGGMCGYQTNQMTQGRGERQDEPDQEEPQAVPRLGPGCRGWVRRCHELTTSMLPAM